jgi:hypothetical protein
MVGFAPSVSVRKTGRTGYNISVETSANKLAKASRYVFLDKPENALRRAAIGGV